MGPDFLGVGPERTGTTWLYENLSKSSRVWCPPLKELRYFWENEAFPQEGLVQRYDFVRSWHRRQYAHYGCTRFGYFLRHPIRIFSERERLTWDFRYLFSRHTDEWYLSSFSPGTDKISGEISPQYFFLPEPTIQHIHAVVPNAKIIVSLREPLDWVWSFARMNMEKGYLRNDEASLKAFIEKKIARSQFTPALSRWYTHFSKERVLVVFYDDLSGNPKNFLRKILRFLDLDVEEWDLNMPFPINMGPRVKMPESLVQQTKKGWREDIQKLSELVPDVPIEWLRDS